MKKIFNLRNYIYPIDKAKRIKEFTEEFQVGKIFYKES